MSAEISKAVQQLLEARRSGIQVAPPFALPDRDAVYAIQDGVVRALTLDRQTEEILRATLGAADGEAALAPDVETARRLVPGNVDALLLTAQVQTALGQFAAVAIEAYLVRGRPELAAKGKGTSRLFVNSLGRPLSRQSAYGVVEAAAQRAGGEGG